MSLLDRQPGTALRRCFGKAEAQRSPADPRWSPFCRQRGLPTGIWKMQELVLDSGALPGKVGVCGLGRVGPPLHITQVSL